MTRDETRKMQRLEDENARLREALAHAHNVTSRLIHEVTTYRIAVRRIDDEVAAVKTERGDLGL